MGLMEVELMILQCPVLDGPIFNRPLNGHDGGRISGIVKSAFLPFDRDKKKRFGIVLRKVKVAPVSDRGCSQPLKSRLPVSSDLTWRHGIGFERLVRDVGLDGS